MGKVQRRDLKLNSAVVLADPHEPGLEILLLAMTDADQLPLAQVRDHLSEVVERIEREHGRVVITRHGRPAAVVLSVDDLESLEETLEILGNQRLLADIRRASQEIAAGKASVLGKADARALIGGR